MFYFQQQIIDYICTGKIHGSFHFHLMVGDIYKMLEHADDTNRIQMPYMARWIKQHAPAGCYGTITIVNDWCKAGGLKGLAGQEAVNRWKIIAGVE